MCCNDTKTGSQRDQDCVVPTQKQSVRVPLRRVATTQKQKVSENQGLCRADTEAVRKIPLEMCLNDKKEQIREIRDCVVPTQKQSERVPLRCIVTTHTQ